MGTFRISNVALLAHACKGTPYGKELLPNNSFKPNPLRSGNGVAD